ncbi:hypothetical protein [Chromobacterium violaceum]|uniref:hypothetical protein n=1 Tax=Chromobacterium violaceum TaxID=536 RepID=UPI001B32197F|nr:hypothetical protein [Chromobacterium violaceum]MBP4045974.1 hypothetical protein [Chromobacterium violaceum]
MATIDPTREARRALRHISRVKNHLDQLPDTLRGEIFGLPARQTPLILALFPETLCDLLEAVYGVECARERLLQSLAAFGLLKEI